MSNIIPLESIQIAKPCRADWAAMTGDERARFCGSCHKNVYDLSSMTRAEAEALILEKEGRLCVRLYRREDGTVITSDCPVGITPAQKPLRWVGAAFAAILSAFAGWTGRPAQARPTVCSHTAAPAVMGKIAVTMGEPLPAPIPTPHPQTVAPVKATVKPGKAVRTKSR